MGQVTTMAAVCLLSSVLAVLLKKSNPEMALLLTGAAAFMGLILLSRSVEEITAFLREMVTMGGLLPELFAPLLKTAAIALISRISSDLCRDAGESAMASLVETAGAFGAILVSLPLMEAVWEMLQVLT